MAARHVRQGDLVVLTTGKDKGRTGKVLRVLTDRDDPSRERVIVEGLNMHTKHVRPSEANPQGGLSTVEMSIHISNVSPADGNGKATRVRYQTRDDGSKARVAATTGDQIGRELKKARK